MLCCRRKGTTSSSNSEGDIACGRSSGRSSSETSPGASSSAANARPAAGGSDGASSSATGSNAGGSRSSGSGAMRRGGLLTSAASLPSSLARMSSRICATWRSRQSMMANTSSGSPWMTSPTTFSPLTTDRLNVPGAVMLHSWMR